MFNKLSPLLFTGIFSVGSVFAETLRFAEYERDGVGKPAEYNFENSSSGDFEITGVPIDADWNRAGYARAKERAYFLIGVQGTVDEFYVCLGSDSGVKYQKDYGKAKLVGIPSNLDTSNFSIGFDHNNGRLFYAGLTKSRDGLFLAEFSDPEFSKGKGKFENGSAVPIKNVPDDVEWDRWAFSWGSSLSLHAAGEGTRLYVVRMNAGRFSFDFEDTTVEQVAVRNVPENSDSQWIEIGTDGDDRSHRYLVQALRADDIFSDAVPIGDGFWMSSWFGTFFGDDFPWVIRSEEEGFCILTEVLSRSLTSSKNLGIFCGRVRRFRLGLTISLSGVGVRSFQPRRLSTVRSSRVMG